MSQTTSRRVACVWMIAAVMFLAATGSGDAGGHPRETIEIGAIADLSQRPGSVEGQILRATLDSAVARIDAAGGINGRRLQVVYVDPRDDPAEALAQVRRLVSQGRVDILYGGTLNSECAAVEELAGWVGVVYVMGSSCKGDALTTRSCNEYSFRLTPAGRQLTDPLAAYIVGSLGKRWIVVYPDYLPGRTQAVDWRDSLNQAGASVTAEVAVPLGAAESSHYFSALPAENSSSGIILAGTAADQTRLLEMLDQRGYAELYPVVGSGDWATYHDPASEFTLGHSTLVGIHPVDPYPGDRKLAGAGASNDEAAIRALGAAMIASDFAGKADTRRLIAALEDLAIPGGSDSAIDPGVMGKTDHQARIAEDVLRIRGQGEEVVRRISPADVPMIGDCHV